MLTNEQLVDSLIVDCNNAVKEITSGKYLSWCAIMVGMGQKLANLRKTMSADLRYKDDVIAQLKEELKKAGREVIDRKPEEIETVIGNIMGKNDHKESQRMVGENAKD